MIDLKTKKVIYEKSVSKSLLITCAMEKTKSQLIACGGLDTQIYLYTVNKKEDMGKMNKLKEMAEHTGIITCCSFLDERFLISGSNDSTAFLWDINKDGNSVRKFIDHKSVIICLDVCVEDPNFIITGSCDGTARFWDVRTLILVSMTPHGSLVVRVN